MIRIPEKSAGIQHSLEPNITEYYNNSVIFGSCEDYYLFCLLELRYFSGWFASVIAIIAGTTLLNDKCTILMTPITPQFQGGFQN